MKFYEDNKKLIHIIIGVLIFLAFLEHLVLFMTMGKTLAEIYIIFSPND